MHTERLQLCILPPRWTGALDAPATVLTNDGNLLSIQRTYQPHHPTKLLATLLFILTEPTKDFFGGPNNKLAFFDPPTGAYKYAFCSIFQNLPDYLVDFFEIWQNLANFATFATKC